MDRTERRGIGWGVTTVDCGRRHNKGFLSGYGRHGPPRTRVHNRQSPDTSQRIGRDGCRPGGRKPDSISQPIFPPRFTTVSTPHRILSRDGPRGVTTVIPPQVHNCARSLEAHVRGDGGAPRLFAALPYAHFRSKEHPSARKAWSGANTCCSRQPRDAIEAQGEGSKSTEVHRHLQDLLLLLPHAKVAEKEGRERRGC